MAERVRLQLLRSPQLLRPDGRAAALNRKDAALLALLAVDGPTSRERVVALLWPGDEEATGRNTLRQRLFRLKRAAGAELVRSDGPLALQPEVEHDLQGLERALEADPRARAGELLGELCFDELPDFADWLAGARQRWRSARGDRLAEIASRLEAQERIAAALACAERLARDEPLLEHAQRRLMKLHYRRGDRSAALAVFERLRETLDVQLGETPSPETQELVALIEASLSLPVATPPPSPLAVLRPPRLIGREREWALLEQAWSDGRLVVVRGEPGIGKSRLLGEFAAAHGAPAPVQARPGDEPVAYALLARLLRQLLDGRTAPPEALRPSLAPLLPELGPPPARVLRAGELRRAVGALLQLLAPAAIVVDDLQFADAATLELLPALIGGTRNCRWLLALRAAEVPGEVRRWLAELELDRWLSLELPPLDLAQVETLLCSLALPELDSTYWGPRLHRHTGGNPMFILETLLAMLRDPGGAPGPPDVLPVPDNLGQLIRRRLEQLTPMATKLARVMAVAGQDFDSDLAAAVLECHPLDFADAWRELEQAHVTTASGLLVHDLVQQALRHALPAPLSRWLHGRIARRLDDRGAAAARRAHHWQVAGEERTAGGCFMLAAAAARQAGRRVEEVSFLDAAAACFERCADGVLRFDALLLAVIASREAESMSDALRRAESLVAGAQTERQRGMAWKETGVCHLQGADVVAAAAALERSIGLLDAAGDEHDAQHARYLLALTDIHLRGAASAVTRLQALVPWAEALSDRDLAHAFGSDLGIALELADRRREAEPFFERSIAHFDRVRDRADSAAARLMLARGLVFLGQAERACALIEAAMRDRSELADGGSGQGIEAIHAGRIYCELGRYADALTLLEPLHARLGDSGAPALRAGAALTLARVHAYLGQETRARQAIAGLEDGLPYYLQAGLLWVRALLIPERPVERAQLLGQAVSRFAAIDLASVRLPIEIDAVAAGAESDAVVRLEGLIEECHRREVPAAALLGRMRLIRVLLERGEAAAASRWATGLLEATKHTTTAGAYWPELYWACHLAARADGDEALARYCLEAAAGWVERTAQTQVPAAFRAGFLERNPVNRAIRLAAGHWARSGVTDG